MSELAGLFTPELGLVAAIVVAAGLFRGFAGFGGGLILVPSLGLLLGPVVAVPLVVLLDMAASVQLLPEAVRLARLRTVAPLGLAATLTIPLGGWLLASVDGRVLQKAISATVLICVVLLWSGWRYRGRPSAPVTAATGLASGLLTGAAGVGGPPVILFFLSGPDTAPNTRASLICYFAITQVVALLTYLAGGLLGARALAYALIVGPLFLLATFCGTRAFGRVNERLFRYAALAFLTGVALCGLLVKGDPG